MDQSNFNIQLTEGTKELIIRTGEAKELIPAPVVDIKGRIETPGNWFTAKRHLYDWNRGHVLVGESSITLIWGEHQSEGQVYVRGDLTLFTHLEKFKINKGNTYSHKELGQFLKMNRVWFRDVDENLRVVSNLERFKARVTQELESGNDMKGNKKYLFEQSVTHDIPLKFQLGIPLYDLNHKLTFEVEICFDITDGNSKFWLESRELQELMQTERDAIISRELSKFPDDNPVVIYS